MCSDLTTAYLRWAFIRAALARGWWLCTGVYLVVVADLSPTELVLVGVGQHVTVLLAEVPAGVLADTVSRRLALVVAHVVMGAGMAMTGVVTAVPGWCSPNVSGASAGQSPAAPTSRGSPTSSTVAT